MEELVTLSKIMSAWGRLYDVVNKTSLVSSYRISPNVFFKAENTQRTGSFKYRGAYNKISLLTDEEAKHGVVACSAGNHAQGVALAATKKKVKSIVCMPANAPKRKVEATKGYGAEVRLVDGNYDDAAKEAARLSKEEGYTFIHPFDDPDVIAGQGTIAFEIFEDLPRVEQILVPVGGGGLISGIAVAIKTMIPKCKVIGVQAANVPSMYESFKKGKIVTVPDNTSIADGLHVLTPGKLTFDIVNKYVDDMITVTEDEINQAIDLLIECPKLVCEGAGAVAPAAFIFGKANKNLKTVCIASGGNIDITTLDQLIKKGIENGLPKL